MNRQNYKEYLELRDGYRLPGIIELNKTDPAEGLMALSWMKYMQEIPWRDWFDSTGVDPRQFPGIIWVDQTGKCIWTDKAEEIWEREGHRRQQIWLSDWENGETHGNDAGNGGNRSIRQRA